jgi:hypothetical protein
MRLFDLDKFGLKSGSLETAKHKWVVSNLAGTRTYANLGVSLFTFEICVPVVVQLVINHFHRTLAELE